VNWDSSVRMRFVAVVVGDFFWEVVGWAEVEERLEVELMVVVVCVTDYFVVMATLEDLVCCEEIVVGRSGVGG